ncbi:MAG: cytochrome c oxidase assembly protein [Candidatus Acidiferrales bacterium]|jgi:cytochrome c oxidase assembly factor CtaG
MPPAAQAVLASWSFPPFVTALNLLTALLYIRGWSALRQVVPRRFTVSRLASFLCGLATLEIALASPIDTFDPFLLFNHMLQHMFLMMLVPPLVLLGDPAIPLLHGLPRWASRDALGPFLSWPALAWLGRWLTHPAIAWLLMALAMIGWHLPGPYELALRSPGWHEVEHACFLIASLLFWWPVIQPWPSHPQWPRWTMPVYLLLADFVNSVVSAFLVFSDRIYYPWYLAVPRLGGISAQNDQVAAGAIMWAIGSFAFLIPAVAITVKLLSPIPPEPESARGPAPPESFSRRYVLPALMLALPLAALAYGWLAPDTIDADGAVVRLQDASGPFRVTVFGEPGALPAGPSDVCVLVQDRNSGEAILDAVVDIEIYPLHGKAASGAGVRATREQSTNKLLEAATIDLPNPGSWQLHVSVRRGSDRAEFATNLDVVRPAGERAGFWPYLLWLAVAVALVALHRLLRPRALQRNPRLPQPL